MSISALRRGGSLARVLSKESSQDVVRCPGLRTGPGTTAADDKDALDRRYADMCGPVDTKPLVDWWPGGKARRPVEPVVVVHARGLSLNAEAIRELQGDTLAVGIDYIGRLIVAPAGSLKNTAAIYRKPKKYNNYLGGASLTAWLVEQGFVVGIYQAKIDHQGWLFVDKSDLVQARARKSAD